MKTLYTKICLVCNKPFSYQKYPSTEKAHPKITCSNKCRYKLVSKRLSGRFIPNGANEKDFSKWITTSCKHCKKELFYPQSLKRMFCSIKCKGLWQAQNLKGENNPNWKPPELRKKSTSVKRKIRKFLLKDRVICEHCSASQNLQVHHKDQVRDNNSLDNLLLLCKECHALKHEKQGQIRTARFIRSHPQTK